MCKAVFTTSKTVIRIKMTAIAERFLNIRFSLSLLTIEPYTMLPIRPPRVLKKISVYANPPINVMNCINSKVRLVSADITPTYKARFLAVVKVDRFNPNGINRHTLEI